MVYSLAGLLKVVLSNLVERRVGGAHGGCLRLVMGGPPLSVLRDLFSLLTRGGNAPWEPQPGLALPVFLVTSRPAAHTGLPSCECNWDFALTVRNSYPNFLLLVDPASWDDRTYSILNATENIGSPLPPIHRLPRSLRQWSPLYADLVEAAARLLDWSPGELESVIRLVLQDLPRLEPEQRERWPWELLGRAVQLAGAHPEPDDLAAHWGLVALGTRTDPERWEASRDVLEELSEFLAERGLDDGVEELASTPVGGSLRSELEELKRHVRKSAGSSAAFRRAPCFYYYVHGNPPPEWWKALTVRRLEELLAQAGTRSQGPSLELRCSNSLNGSPVCGEPYVVETAPVFEARHSGGEFSSPQLIRQGQVIQEPGPCPSPWSTVDGTPPTHSSPLRYTLTDSGTSVSVAVVVLEKWEPKGLFGCSGADRLGKPRRSAGRLLQQIVLRTGGPTKLQIFCAPDVAWVHCPELGFEVPRNGPVVEMMVDFIEDTTVEAELCDSSGKAIGRIAAEVLIQEGDTGASRSHFEALVRAHQEGKTKATRARAADVWARRVEQVWLELPSSWKPCLATPGWASLPFHRGLAESGIIGRMLPQVDPRPSGLVQAPDEFLAAREAVRGWLASCGVPVPEVDLSVPKARELAKEYLARYEEWFARSPSDACWVDTIAVLEPESSGHGQHSFAAYEPVVVLMLPTHPVRFAWMVAAQHVLAQGLEKPCPLAGFLDPSRCPDIFPLALARAGHEPRWTAYVSLPCEDALWGVYWNVTRLREIGNHSALAELRQAGLGARGIQSGFSASQARKTLDEVSRIFPTRAVLRVGVTSSGEAGSSCTEGLVAWCRERYGSGEDPAVGFRSLEVYDDRPAGARPAPEEIADVAGETGHAVKWFAEGPPVPKDLVIIDHLGAYSPAPEVHPWLSPASQGSLVRVRLRADRGRAEWIVESRVAATGSSEDSLLDQLGQVVAAIERMACDRAGCSHISFAPNVQLLGEELQEASFVAVSSAEIDPACLARGALQAGGYLWDYQLPQGHGAAEQRSGFYLVAKPPDAAKRSIMFAVELISTQPVNVDELLSEASRRGIPVLKRLAAGGTQARGELGVLLATRLIQDAFRGPVVRPRIPVLENNAITTVLPVDPYLEPLGRIRKALEGEAAGPRADLLVVRCNLDPQAGRVRVLVIPIEVKFREGVMTRQDKAASLRQAAGLGALLHRLLVATPPNGLWELCRKAFLAEILNYGLRVYGDPAVSRVLPDEWVKVQQQCVAFLLSQESTIAVSQEGRLVVFDQSPNSYMEDVDEDGFLETMVLGREDARGLLEGGNVLPSVADNVTLWLDLGDALVTGGSVENGSRTGVTVPEAQLRIEAESGLGEVCGSTPAVPGVPPETRRRVEDVFAGFVGNSAAVATLKRAILKAFLAAPPEPPKLPASYLLTGNPSTGKTELARRVARALDLPFVALDGRAVGKREKLFELIDAALLDRGQRPVEKGTRYQRPLVEYPPCVVFIDEVHLMPRPIQESLLTALEPKDRTVLLPDRVAMVPHATFLFATTRPSEVDAAFRSRCTEIPLQDYTEGEVAAIVGLSYPYWPEDLRRRIARYGRLVPRVALELARELEMEATVSEHPERTLEEHLEEVRRTRRIDRNGLRPEDIEYLELLEREGRPLGENSILAMLGNIDKNRFLEEVEPLLVGRLRLVRKTDRGRELTPEGRRYLIERRRRAED